MKSATLEYVTEVMDHPNADKMSIAKIKGWKVCIKKNEYKSGDLCIYVATDTILDPHPHFEFLRNKQFRIKPIKLRGQLSEGILFPTSLLKDFANGRAIVLENDVSGTDVSELIGAKHYEKPLPSELVGEARGSLPSFLKKTDEENLENVIGVLEEMRGRPYYISTKIDGQSGTFYLRDGVFGVCSRKIDLLETEGNGFWKVARKFDIENQMRKVFGNKNVAIQGEVYGPGVQKNPLGVEDLSLAVFNIWDMETRTYGNLSDLISFCDETYIPMVSIIEQGLSFDKTFGDLQSMANALCYVNGHVAEGIVIRPQIMFKSVVMDSHCSFKVINETFKLKHE